MSRLAARSPPRTAWRSRDAAPHYSGWGSCCACRGPKRNQRPLVTLVRPGRGGGAAMTIRLGTGAGFSADRLDPAVDLVAKGRLDAIVFECIGERTLAFGHR